MSVFPWLWVNVRARCASDGEGGAVGVEREGGVASRHDKSRVAAKSAAPPTRRVPTRASESSSKPSPETCVCHIP